MIKVSVLYPAGDGITFDMDYYKTKHMEIVQRVMPGLRKVEIDSRVDGPYIAVGNLYFDSLEALGAAMGGAGEAMADVVNFTNAQAVLQTSEVVTG
ncbi:MAG: EthD family reductase [Ilumatobacteraceae bacterium]